MKQAKALFYCLILLPLLLGACGQKHKATSSVLFPYYDKGPGIRWLSPHKYTAGYMDLNGNRVTDNDYLSAEPFTEGLGCVSTLGDDGQVLYGYIDSAARFVIEPRFKDARPFQNGLAWVWENEETGWGAINHKGQFVTAQLYAPVSTDFYNGYAIAYIKRGVTQASKFEKAIVGVFTLGLLDAPDRNVYACYKIALNGDTTLLQDRCLQTNAGNPIHTAQQNHLALFWTDEGYGFNKITAEEYDNEKSNYINVGQPFIKPIYRHAENFKYGHARVTFENGEKGYIDTNGTVVLRFTEERPY